MTGFVISPYTVGLYSIPVVVAFYIPAIVRGVTTFSKNLLIQLPIVILLHFIGIGVSVTPLFIFESGIGGMYSLIPLAVFYGLGFYTHPFSLG